MCGIFSGFLALFPFILFNCFLEILRPEVTYFHFSQSVCSIRTIIVYSRILLPWAAAQSGRLLLCLSFTWDLFFLQAFSRGDYRRSCYLMNRGSCPEPSYGKQKISPGEFPGRGSVALTKPWKGVESTLPNQITEILLEAIKKEFLSPLALLSRYW